MWLLLDTNRKSYMGSPTAPLDLAACGLEKSNSYPDFEGLYLKRAQLNTQYVIVKH